MKSKAACPGHPMRILVFNCGSSSLKYRLLEMPSEIEIAGGEAQRVGARTGDASRILHRKRGKTETHVRPMDSIETAFNEVMRILEDDTDMTPDVIAHRMVHGGTAFVSHTLVDPQVVARLEAIQDLAPIHNPPATGLLKSCTRLRPGLPQVVVFDTVFHSTIPDYARTYALPPVFRTELGIRKYGFHGTSHHFVASEAARMLNMPLERLNAVSCHLGSGGASLCAIVEGKSVDNTMGYTPLQGLMMSTRTGDLDPSIGLNLLARHNGDHASVSDLLNKRSGVLGVSGLSSDIRDVLGGIEAGSADIERLNLAAQIYLWRIRKYLGAYLAVVGRAHAVIFTDTIGETVPAVRHAACADMDVFGIRIDSERNNRADVLPADIASDDSAVRVLVIATNEELAIARQAFSLLRAA